MIRAYVLGCALLAACGGGDDGVEEGPAPAMITITGLAKSRSTSSMALAGVQVNLYRNSDPNTSLGSATTDMSGNYTMAVTTGGKAIYGFFTAKYEGYLDTYYYPPENLDADDTYNPSLVTQSTLDLLTGTLCGLSIEAGKGMIAGRVIDADGNNVEGATVTASPAAGLYCYDLNGFPNRNATMTDPDGTAYMINLSGDVKIGAVKAGSTFNTHTVKVRPGTFTTTLLQP